LKITRRRSCTPRSGTTFGSKNERAGRTGFAHLFEHMMFKGSKNVEPEGHPSWISSIGGQSNAYTTEDATVFWETVPAQYLPLVLWLEADRLATLRIDEDVFKTGTRGREGRAPDAHRQPALRPVERADLRPGVHGASLQTPDDREHEGPWRRRRSATSVISSAPTTSRTTRRWCWSATSTRRRRRISSRNTSAGCRSRIGRCRATSRRSRRRRRSGGCGSTRAGRCLRSSSPITSPTTAIPIPIRCTSPRRCCRTGQSSRIYRKLVYEKGLALAAFGGGNIIEDPNLFYAVAIVQPATRPTKTIAALIAELDELRSQAITAGELQQAKNQFARDYIFSRESNKDKASQLGHAAVIHNDIKTADGEFDIFMNITQADVQRVARKYFTPENRLVITIMPRGAGAA
jgi:zinc protease